MTYSPSQALKNCLFKGDGNRQDIHLGKTVLTFLLATIAGRKQSVFWRSLHPLPCSPQSHTCPCSPALCLCWSWPCTWTAPSTLLLNCPLFRATSPCCRGPAPPSAPQPAPRMAADASSLACSAMSWAVPLSGVGQDWHASQLRYDPEQIISPL